MLIYKIQNKINGKCYIGLTTTPLTERWKQHLTQARIGNQKPLYRAMRKYGIDNFIVEIIDDKIASIKELGEKERYYIRQLRTFVPFGYNLTRGGESNQLDANPRTKLTVEDVFYIRELYAQGMQSIKEVFELYKNRISFSAFEKIWEGKTWKTIHMDVYTVENLKRQNSFKGLYGEKNGNGISDDTILQARKYYVFHTLKETYDKYGEKYKTIDSFRNALNYSYKHLPLYRKTSNQWILKDKIITDITLPVSTISVSGE